jgi:hypothetical protein
VIGGQLPSAIDHTAKLPQRESRGGHPPRRQFRRDPHERLIVGEALRLELTVAPADELLRGLREVPEHLRDYPRRLTWAERAGTSQVRDEVVVHLSGARHLSSVAQQPKRMQESCPKSGKNRPVSDT